MTILYIDSTYDISVGILDEKLGWKFLNTFSGQKASSVLQKETHKILDEFGLKITDLKAVVTVAGPGFYTGLRLSEGFADVLSFNGLKHFSFYSHTIPWLLDYEQGVWLTKAYRGEYFFHHWDSQSSKNELVLLKDLTSYLENLKEQKLFIHSDVAIDEHIKKSGFVFTSTKDLLGLSPNIIFNKVLKSSSKVESFYFRAPEDEFKANP